MGTELTSDVGLICAVGGLALLAIFGLPSDDSEPANTTGGDIVTAPPRTLDQVAAVAGVALLVAAGFFQIKHLW
jgi:hypothetical protein